MRGVNKKIIEITDPENEDIEKVIVFLKPGSKINVRREKETAKSYVAGLCCEPRRRHWSVRVAAIAAALCAAAFLLHYFL